MFRLVCCNSMLIENSAIILFLVVVNLRYFSNVLTEYAFVACKIKNNLRKSNVQFSDRIVKRFHVASILVECVSFYKSDNMVSCIFVLNMCEI